MGVSSELRREYVNALFYHGSELRFKWTQLLELHNEILITNLASKDFNETHSSQSFKSGPNEICCSVTTSASHKQYLLEQQFQGIVREHAQPACVAICHKMRERCPLEIRELIYGYLYGELNQWAKTPPSGTNVPVLIPKHPWQDDHQIVNFNKMCRTQGKAFAKKVQTAELEMEMAAIRNRPIFAPEWMSLQVSKEVTRLYFERNRFQFRDSRECVEPFLTTPFPCGDRPCDLIRNILVHVRCEKFDNFSWHPRLENTEERYGVYDIIRNNVECLSRIPFNDQAAVTLAIVPPVEFDTNKGEIYGQRIMLNFVEALMDAYLDLQSRVARVSVKSVHLAYFYFKNKDKTVLPMDHMYFDETWKFELAKEGYLKRREDPQKGGDKFPYYAYPGEKVSEHRVVLAGLVQELEETKREEHDVKGRVEDKSPTIEADEKAVIIAQMLNAANSFEKKTDRPKY